MIPELYEHQKKVIAENKLKCGLFTGTGTAKTRTSLEIAEGKILVICPKQQKLDETWQKNAKKFELVRDLTVISKEELRRDWAKLPAFDTVIIDECFVKGTKVLTKFGYKNIENIKEEDIVVTAVGYGKVYKTIKKTANRLFIFKLKNGKSFTCTSNHPILTTEGWEIAKNINNSTLFVQSDMLYLADENKNKTSLLQTVWGENSKRMASWRFLWKLENLLFNKMSNGNNIEGLTQRAKEKRKAYFNFMFKADERKQSNEKQTNSKESFNYTEKDWSSTKNSRRKWYGNSNSSKSIMDSTWKRMVFRTCYLYKNVTEKWLPHLLQNRYCKSNKKDSNRSGWIKSWFNFQTTARQKENKLFETVGVESIEIQEQKNTEVFNLSVKGHPSYVVEGIVVHNCHNNLGVMPDTRQRHGVQIPKTSQIFEATLNYLRKYPPKRLYLCSATPVPKPMAVWGIATIFGQNWDFFKFREKYYFEIRVGARRVWIPRQSDEIKERLAELVKKFGYTGSLNDFFDVPEQTHKVVNIELTPEQEKAIKEMTLAEADPLVRRARLRTIENGVLYGKKIVNLDEKIDNLIVNTTIYPSKKIDYILERAMEFPKLLIFANYIAQINEIAKALRTADYEVSVLTGKTKDRKNIIQDAEKARAHIVIAQSGISSGYELPSFPCVIYASKSWQFVHFEQSLGRVLRANRMKKNLYIHLVVDGCDKDCHDSIMDGKDFMEKLSLTPTDTEI